MVPLFRLMVNRACSVPITWQVLFPIFFFHSFPLSALIPLKVHGWLPTSGCTEVCPSRSHRLAVLPFCPFSHLGGIPFCQLESRLLPFPFSYFSILVPRDASHLRHERSLIISSFLAGSFGACGFYSVSYFLFLSFSFELS